MLPVKPSSEQQCRLQEPTTVPLPLDGSFALPGVRQGDKLEISCIGYAGQTITWNGGVVNVVLAEDAEMLEGTIVTALGITREKKTLGYAIQDVKGDALMDARESNLANALTGKVAGVSIVRSSNGPGASSRIVLRGNSSLTGLNQPLIVIDGVPMDNFVGASNNDFWNPSADTKTLSP